MREIPGRSARSCREGMFGSSRKIASEREREHVSRLSREGAAPRAGLWRTLGVAVAVTLLATLLSYFLPDSWAATGVGFTFLAATYWLVIYPHHASERLHDFGGSLRGVLEAAPLSPSRLLRSPLL